MLSTYDILQAWKLIVFLDVNEGLVFWKLVVIITMKVVMFMPGVTVIAITLKVEKILVWGISHCYQIVCDQFQFRL
jgi:hypothetical protein